jgi:hypothetical protein
MTTTPFSQLRDPLLQARADAFARRERSTARVVEDAIHRNRVAAMTDDPVGRALPFTAANVNLWIDQWTAPNEWRPHRANTRKILLALERLGVVELVTRLRVGKVYRVTDNWAPPHRGIWRHISY